MLCYNSYVWIVSGKLTLSIFSIILNRSQHNCVPLSSLHPSCQYVKYMSAWVFPSQCLCLYHCQSDSSCLSLYVCRSVCLSASAIHLYLYQSVSGTVCTYVCMSVYSSVYLSTLPSANQLIRPCPYLSISPSIIQFISIYQSRHPFSYLGLWECVGLIEFVLKKKLISVISLVKSSA